MFLLCLKHIFLDTKNFRGFAPVVAGLYILQVRYEPHLSDKVCCSEASRFSITKIWYA